MNNRIIKFTAAVLAGTAMLTGCTGGSESSQPQYATDADGRVVPITDDYV